MDTYVVESPAPVQRDETVAQGLERESHTRNAENGRTSGLNQDGNIQNERRVILIKKQVQHSLTMEEQQELEQLQSEISRQINTAHPLPFDALKRLEEYIDEAECRLGHQD